MNNMIRLSAAVSTLNKNKWKIKIIIFKNLFQIKNIQLLYYEIEKKMAKKNVFIILFIYCFSLISYYPSESFFSFHIIYIIKYL